MPSEIALLGFLRHQPLHGYAIHQRLSDPSGLGPVWTIKRSHLYALLGKLEDAGYVTTTTELQDSRPPRKLYHLTETGNQTFQAWLRRPVTSGRSLRLDFLVKLYFARQEGPEVAPALVTAQRRVCNEWLAEAHSRIHEKHAAGQRYRLLVDQFRQGQIEAMLAWLTACEEGWSGEQ